MEENEQNKKQCDALELIYKDAIDNIHLYKQQQFTITNYAIALYVAIVALYDRFDKATDLEKSTLSSIALVVLIVGILFIFRFHYSMVGNRQRMAKIKESFDDASKEAWKAYDKPNHTSYCHNIGIAFTLAGVLLLGALAAWWAIYRVTPNC